MSEDLANRLKDELKRNIGLIHGYEYVGLGKSLVVHLIKHSIVSGEQAIRSGDVIQMEKAYKWLMENK